MQRSPERRAGRGAPLGSFACLIPEARIRAVYAAAGADLSATDAPELTAAIRATGIVGTRRDLLIMPLLTARATGGNPDQAVLVAAAHHLFCLAAAVLDDVQDREGGDALWLALGVPQAVNIGVALVFATQRTLARLSDQGAPSTQVMTLQADFARAGYCMCAGQHLDLKAFTRDAPALETYWRLAAAKSGAFYALGARAGARLGTDDAATLSAYSDYGHHLGLVVQAVNDLRGLVEGSQTDSSTTLRTGPSTTSESRLGSFEGAELAQGRLTLPVAYALTVAPEGVRDELLACLTEAQRRPEPASIDPEPVLSQLKERVEVAAGRAAEMLVELGALHYTLLMVEQHRRQAATALARVPGAAVDHQELLALLDGSIPDLFLPPPAAPAEGACPEPAEGACPEPAEGRLC